MFRTRSETSGGCYWGWCRPFLVRRAQQPDLEAVGIRIALRPTLFLLDPFVRLHRIDENAAADVAPMLAYLRALQRDRACAVLLVHHARTAAAHLRAGQALRGSSELHPWVDSNLYLRCHGASLRLTVEHRAAPGHDGPVLELRADGDALALYVVDAVEHVDGRDVGRLA